MNPPNFFSSSSVPFPPSPSDVHGTEKNFVELMKSFLKKQDIHPDVLELHHQNLQKLRQIGVIAQAIDKQQFKEGEFLFFIEVKNHFLSGIGDYKGLNQSLRLFRVAIDAKNSFLSIEQIELMYRSIHQQEFYELVFELLARNVSTQAFHEQVREKLQKVLPFIKTEKGKQALHSYMRELDNLAKQDKLGLRLLYLFKRYQLTDYSILRKVSDIVTYLTRQNAQDFDYVLRLVTNYYHIFEDLGRIIGIPAVKSTPENYSLILQYLALRQKHQTNYFQFQKLIEILRDWEQSYQVVQEIRRRHSPIKYHQPPEFQEKLTGESVYKHYQHYLLQD